MDTIHFFIFLISRCKDDKYEVKNNPEAVSAFKKSLTIVEKSLTEETINSEVLFDAISNLERVSGINSYENTSEYGNYKIPTKYDVDDWKNWLTINQESLGYNKREKKISIQNPKNLEKEPVELYKKYVNDLKQIINSKDYVLQDIDYLVIRLEELTGYEKINFESICNCKLPKNEDILFFENWLETKKENLKWNSSTQRLYLDK